MVTVELLKTWSYRRPGDRHEYTYSPTTRLELPEATARMWIRDGVCRVVAGRVASAESFEPQPMAAPPPPAAPTPGTRTQERVDEPPKRRRGRPPKASMMSSGK